MFVVASGAVMQPLLGWILDINWKGEFVHGAPVYAAHAYTVAFTVLLFGNVMSLFCAVLIRETYCRPSTVIVTSALDPAH
jgi:hypothetical protein